MYTSAGIPGTGVYAVVAGDASGFATSIVTMVVIILLVVVIGHVSR
jgi:hypothetical protein